MLARFLSCTLLMAVMVTGIGGTPAPSFAQTTGPIPTFDLDRIVELALERNPAIAGARSVIL